MGRMLHTHAAACMPACRTQHAAYFVQAAQGFLLHRPSNRMAATETGANAKPLKALPAKQRSSAQLQLWSYCVHFAERRGSFTAMRRVSSK